jgi:glycosyltransferase involved in cell wall biosynthesis
MPHISVVTPVYKAERILPELYRRLKETLEGITKDFEIIMVNDHSPQCDWEVILGLVREDPRVKGLDLSRNFGQHYAITAGLDYAEGDWVVVMDCDLQDQPEEIPRLFAKALEGYDVVFGRRYERKDSLVKKVTSMAYYRVYEYLIDEKIDGSIANYSIISRKVVEGLRSLREQNRSYGLSVKWLGFRSAAIDIEHAHRYEGSSAYTFRRMMRLAIDSIVSRSNKPLKLSIRMGFVISLVSLVFIIYLVARYFATGVGVEGWTSVMVSIWLISGLMFMNMGILGLYIGKTFDEAKGRPLYVVQDAVGLGDGARRPLRPV